MKISARCPFISTSRSAVTALLLLLLCFLLFTLIEKLPGRHADTD
ncbi:Thiamin ABC transporter, transmembrane component [Cronobacter universalis NCTC 9529]|nr:Thiamin ABC transporter, transmembrane component [Cronobacter universalis NCTC 9529]